MAYTEKNARVTKARLQALREEHDYTLAELAKQLEHQEGLAISPTSLSLYEIQDGTHEKYTRTAAMSIDKLVALADLSKSRSITFWGASIRRSRRMLHLAGN